MDLIKFTTKNGPQIILDVSYASKTFFKAHEKKLLGLLVDSTLP
jgi:hypothetical protein